MITEQLIANFITANSSLAPGSGSSVTPTHKRYTYQGNFVTGRLSNLKTPESRWWQCIKMIQLSQLSRNIRVNVRRGHPLPSVSRPFFYGVRLSPFGTAATNWPVVPAAYDRWWWLWSNRWNANWQGKPKYSEKTCPSATLSTNPTWPDSGSNPGRRGGKPATNRLSYGTAVLMPYIWNYLRNLDEIWY
jgi:hypothetical protein